MTVKLLTKHHLEFLAQARLSLHIYYWKSRVMAHIYLVLYYCPIVYNKVYIRLFWRYWYSRSGGLHSCVHTCIFDIALFTGLIPAYYHTCDLGSRSQVFGHVQNSPPRPFSCFLLARSLPINKNKRATVLHLIFAILSCLLVKAPKRF